MQGDLHALESQRAARVAELSALADRLAAAAAHDHATPSRPTQPQAARRHEHLRRSRHDEGGAEPLRAHASQPSLGAGSGDACPASPRREASSPGPRLHPASPQAAASPKTQSARGGGGGSGPRNVMSDRLSRLQAQVPALQQMVLREQDRAKNAEVSLHLTPWL